MVRLKVGYMLYEYKYEKFQFLMVRLKVEKVNICEKIANKFQFLMVRLKGMKAKNLNNCEANFNSLWCD